MKTITAYQCKKCKTIMYPHHYRCLKCNHREFTEIYPTEEGKLLTYTIVDQLPWGLDERARVLGVVEFDNGIKALGLIKAENPQLGMRLKIGWEPVRVIQGVKRYGLSFEPA